MGWQHVPRLCPVRSVSQHLRVLLLLLTLNAYTGSSRGAATAREDALVQASAARRQAAKSPRPFRSIEIFDVASARTIAGAGFLATDGTNQIAVTATHPHGNTPPDKFVGETNEFRLGKLIHVHDDISLFTARAPGIPADRLACVQSRLLRANDALAVVSHDGVRSGRLTRYNLGLDEMLLPDQPTAGTLQLLLPGKQDLSGTSGAPVVLEETGEVVGVLVGALSMGRETAVDFVRLSLAPPISRPPFVPTTIFSLPTVPAPDGHRLTPPTALLPPEVSTLEPGAGLTNIFAVRPFLPATPAPSLYGQAYFEQLPPDYLFCRLELTAQTERISIVELTNDSRPPTAAQVETLFAWLLTVLGPPAEAFRFGEYRARPGQDSVYCLWTGAKTTVVLGANGSMPGQVYLSLKAFDQRIPRRRMLQPDWISPLPTDAKSLQAAVQHLTRQTAKLSSENPIQTK